MKKLILILLGPAVFVVGQCAYAADAAEIQYIEEIIVTGERGDENVMDRAMTVTGFNQEMIQNMGIQSMEDLDVLVPGLQIGNRSQGGGKVEDDHYYMRGLGSERSVNFFSDTSVAVYVNGVWTDQSYGVDGLFDMERVEVARGPQGTTGGRAAIAGSINFVQRAPTDEWDMNISAEIDDISQQRLNLAFGGPIGDTGLSYRLAVQRRQGDGMIENKGLGPDAGEPDQWIVAPSLRWHNDRWDVTARYSEQQDNGTPTASLPLSGFNTTDEFLMNPATGNCYLTTTPEGDEVCQLNPFFGSSSSPSVSGCSNVGADGGVDDNQVVCDPDELKWEVALNAPARVDSYSKNASLDVEFQINESLSLNYKFGWRDSENLTVNDTDRQNRVGGGVCLPDHPKVTPIMTLGAWVEDPPGSGNWYQPQTPELGPDGDPVPTQMDHFGADVISRFCAVDGGGTGTVTDTYLRSVFSSNQTSHELSLYSDFDGPFNFTLGVTTMEGDEPNYYSGTDNSYYEQPWLWMDTSAKCQQNLASLYGVGGSVSGGVSWLAADVYTDQNAMDRASTGLQVFGCPGDPVISKYSDTGVSTFSANPNGESWTFYGNGEYKSVGYYFDAEYEIDETWTVFGGIRRDDDEKDRTESSSADLFFIDSNGTTCTNTSWQIWDDCYSIVGQGLHDSSIEWYEGRGDMDWGATTWNVGVEYRPAADMMIYGRVSTGYRAGGSQGYNQSAAPWQFPSEELMNYELGVKGMFFDSSLQLQATYFFQDFDTYWSYQNRLKTDAELLIDPFSGPYTAGVTGIDGTETQGVELEGAWQITESLTLRGFYNWLDSSIGDYEANYGYTIPGEADSWSSIPYEDARGNPQVAWTRYAEPVQFGGHQFVNQPEHKGSLTLAYDTPIPADMGRLELMTIYNYRSEKFVELLNLDAYAVDAYTRWDIRANWTSPTSAWRASFYVQNLLDEAALHLWSPREGDSAGAPIGTVVEPRSIGLSVSWHNL
jgi:outer membrane receptor protein involved in Fe transport